MARLLLIHVDPLRKTLAHYHWADIAIRLARFNVLELRSTGGTASRTDQTLSTKCIEPKHKKDINTMVPRYHIQPDKRALNAIGVPVTSLCMLMRLSRYASERRLFHPRLTRQAARYVPRTKPSAAALVSPFG